MILLNHVSKTYAIHKKKEGLKESFKSLFKRSYTYIPAVKDVSFTIKQGELVGFIGPNGAGKTTTLKLLSGLLHPSEGKIEVLGFNPSNRDEKYLQQISLVMGQRNQLWWDLPAIETFLLHKDIYEIPDTDFNQTLNELSHLLDVKDILQQPVKNMSLGQRMKCEFIGSLLHKPKIVFLDEPTIGLDVVTQRKVREFIKEYNKKYNATVILTSHYMDDVKEICNRLIIINHGSLLFDGELRTFVQQYANHKILIPIFNSKVTKEELQRFGTVIEFEYPRAVITIPHERVSKIASELLANYEIDDLDINEPQLEDIIHSLFGNEHLKIEEKKSTI